MFLIVLALLALVVWLKVLQKDESKQAASKQECSATVSTGAVEALGNLANIKIQILNGSGIKGLAASLQNELTVRGFTIASIGNADNNVATAGEIHYGPKGAFAAKVLATSAGGFELVKDDALTDSTVQLIAGEQYPGLVDPTVAATQVKTVVAAEAKAQAAVAAGCASPSA